ncbi:hypothetical protein U3516DRAFT_747135 [Neocallimastix sp. 'constans']
MQYLILVLGNPVLAALDMPLSKSQCKFFDSLGFSANVVTLDGRNLGIAVSEIRAICTKKVGAHPGKARSSLINEK